MSCPRGCCGIEGCDRPHYGRGYCNMHWQRMRNLGDAEKVTSRMLPEVERFWSYVDKTDTCWLWTGNLKPDGYAQFGTSSNGLYPLVHRMSYELSVGPIPNGLTLGHLCRVRNCVRPDHLEPVTAYENMRRGFSPFAENLRKESCPRGHEYSDENTWLYRGSRYCRECRRTEARERKRRIREAARVLL